VSAMSYRKTAFVFLLSVALSGCAEGNFLDNFLPSKDTDQTPKTPGSFALSQRQVCGHALDLTSSPLAWDPLSSSAEFVQEALRRNLTVQQCAQLLELPDNAAGQ